MGDDLSLRSASTHFGPSYGLLGRSGEGTRRGRLLHSGADALLRLAATGVGLALDDFGVGASSLTLVEAVTVLCETLGLTTLAEGVETAEQLSTLQSLGCQRAQGFLLGSPVPPEEVTSFGAGRP
jgi:EAL domain-containing protein (putative c-di-GMP-specific phosphodiesterase class I)